MHVFSDYLWLGKTKCGFDISTSSHISNCDGAVLEIYLDHKSQQLQEGLDCKSLVQEVFT